MLCREVEHAVLRSSIEEAVLYLVGDEWDLSLHKLTQVWYVKVACANVMETAFIAQPHQVPSCIHEAFV